MTKTKEFLGLMLFLLFGIASIAFIIFVLVYPEYESEQRKNEFVKRTKHELNMIQERANAEQDFYTKMDNLINSSLEIVDSMPTSEWKFSLPAVVVQFPLKHTDLFTVVLQRKRNTILKHSVLIKRHLAFNYVPFNIVNAVAENIHIGDWLILSPSSKSCTISDIQSLIVVYELSYRKIGYYSNTHIPANKTSLRCSVIDIKNKIIILTKEFETMPADYITIPYGAPNGSIDEVYNKASECLTSWCANGEVLKKELFTPDMELKSNTINETLNKLGLQ